MHACIHTHIHTGAMFAGLHGLGENECNYAHRREWVGLLLLSVTTIRTTTTYCYDDFPLLHLESGGHGHDVADVSCFPL